MCAVRDFRKVVLVEEFDLLLKGEAVSDAFNSLDGVLELLLNVQP